MSGDSVAFSDFATKVRSEIEAALDQYTAHLPGCPARLQQGVRYSLLNGGKRLRPLLVLLAAEACGTARDKAMPAACALEMIHCYSLVHDDLPAMDDDDLRRGQPTNHKVYGDALAILAGDGLQSLAFELMATQVAPPSVAAKCCGLLAQAAGLNGMVGGQADDILGAFSQGDLEKVESTHSRKTGALLTVSLRIGAIIAQADPQVEAALAHYGRCLGLAFQIVDDLLDVEGDLAVVGKAVGKDRDQGKITYPKLLGIESSRQRARELIEEACSAIAPLESRAHRLEALAHFVLERDR